MRLSSFTPTVPFAVERPDGRKKRAPVGHAIGWALTGAGYAVPVFAEEVGLQHGDVAVFGDNMVLAIGLPDRVGEPLYTTAGSDKGPGRPPKPKSDPVVRGPYEIAWGDKTYKLLSSWHFKSGDDEFLFQIPRSSDTPVDPRVEKVNRDGFNELSKTLPVLEYTVVAGQKPAEPAPRKTPRKPKPAPTIDTPEADEDSALSMV